MITRSREATGFLLSVVFVCLAAGRDVYFGALFQRVHPLAVALTAFTLCTLVFLPVALARDRAGLTRLRAHAGTLAWINATTAIAWLSFFHALRIAEPALVQVVFFGIGPLAVAWIDRFVPGVANQTPFFVIPLPYLPITFSRQTIVAIAVIVALALVHVDFAAEVPAVAPH